MPLLIIVLGTPGLLPQDATGISRSSDVFNATNLLRLTSFSLAALACTICIALRVSFAATQPSTLYAIFLASAVLYPIGSADPNASSYFKAVYSIFEWIVAIASVSLALSRIRFPLLCIIIALGISIEIVLFAAVRPDLAYFDHYFASQLGGYVLHPNRLAIVCCVGLVWSPLLSSSFRRLAFQALMLAIVVMTGSRLALIVALSLAFLSVFLNRRVHASMKAVLALAAAISVPAILYAAIDSGMLESGLLRGQSVETLFEANNRTIVWQTAISLSASSPLWGWGWLEGPADIGNHVGQAWWHARNAQNDVLNTAVAAGVVVAALVAFVYLVIVIAPWRRSGVQRPMMVATGAILALHASFEPVLSALVSPTGILVIATFLTLVAPKPSTA